MDNVIIHHSMIKTIIPMKNKSSTEMLIDINREVFGNQLLIHFFQKMGIEGWCMLFEELIGLISRFFIDMKRN